MKKPILRKSFFTLIVSSLFVMVAVGPSMHAGEGVLEGDCEFAFFRCASDALFIPGQYDLMINCYIGYAFCKKYVEGT